MLFDCANAIKQNEERCQLLNHAKRPASILQVHCHVCRSLFVPAVSCCLPHLMRTNTHLIIIGWYFSHLVAIMLSNIFEETAQRKSRLIDYWLGETVWVGRVQVVSFFISYSILMLLSRKLKLAFYLLYWTIDWAQLSEWREIRLCHPFQKNILTFTKG